MDIAKTAPTGAQSVFSSIYNAQNAPQNAFITRESAQNVAGIDSLNNTDRTSHSLQLNDVSHRMEDRFYPSKELQKAREIGGELKGGFDNKKAFEDLSNTLAKAGIINANERVAMEYLQKNAPKLSFDEFNKIASNDTHSQEMQGLLNSVVHKLNFIDSVNGGIF